MDKKEFLGLLHRIAGGRKLSDEDRAVLEDYMDRAITFSLPEGIKATMVVYGNKRIVTGVHSDLYTGGGHALFVDMDAQAEMDVVAAAEYIRDEYEVGKLYVYESSPKKYWIVAFPEQGLSKEVVKRILSDPTVGCDPNYATHIDSLGYCTLRVAPVKSRVFRDVAYKPVVKAVVGSGSENSLVKSIFVELIEKNINVLRKEGYRIW